VQGFWYAVPKQNAKPRRDIDSIGRWQPEMVTPSRALTMWRRVRWWGYVFLNSRDPQLRQRLGRGRNRLEVARSVCAQRTCPGGQIIQKPPGGPHQRRSFPGAIRRGLEIRIGASRHPCSHKQAPLPSLRDRTAQTEACPQGFGPRLRSTSTNADRGLVRWGAPVAAMDGRVAATASAGRALFLFPRKLGRNRISSRLSRLKTRHAGFPRVRFRTRK